MEVIDGIITFNTPSTFFKWLWNYDGELRVAENKNVYENKKLVAKLSFVKRK